jgi:serine/threonine-protein kinase
LGRVVAGRYPLVGLLSAGPTGNLYRALQEPTGTEVAVKAVPPRGADPQRFLRTMQLVIGLAHPSTVRTYEYGIGSDGVFFLVLELLRGRLLSTMLAAEGRFSPDRAVALVCQLLDALAEAHSKGLVHRDLKPAHIMVIDGPWGAEQSKVLDFGIAEAMKVRQSGADTTSRSQTLATPLHQSPEQLRGSGVGPRSDLYSVGTILYELLSGTPLATTVDPRGALEAHLERPVPKLPPAFGVSPDLEAALGKSLAISPESRFADAAQMARALREAGQTSRNSTPEAERADSPSPANAQAPTPGPVEVSAAAQKPPPSEVEPDCGHQQRHAPPSGPPRSRARVRSRSLALAGASGLLLAVGLSVFLMTRGTPEADVDLPEPPVDELDEALKPIAVGPVPVDSAARAERRRHQVQAPSPVKAPAPASVEASASAQPSQPLEAPKAPAMPGPPVPTEKGLVAPARPDGSLLVSCARTCRVYVDRALVGDSPKPIPLVAGEYHLSAKDLGTGETEEQTVKIRAGERTRAVFHFSRSQP